MSDLRKAAQQAPVKWDASAPLVVPPHPAFYTANQPSLHFNGFGKEVMRITRDGIYVAEGVSVDETAQAVLNCLNTHIQRMLEIARADDIAMLHKCLAVMEREAQWCLDETNQESTVLNADIAALKEYLK